MNKLLLSLCLLVLVPVSMASADLKVAVIDLGKTFDSYYATQDAQARIQEKQTSYQKEYQDLVTEYQHMGEDAQKLKDAAGDPTLSADARADKTKALQAKAQDLQNMERKIEEMKTERNNEIKDEMMRRRKEILDQITKVVTDYSGPQGFDLVLDKSSSSSSTGVPSILYTSSKLIDITADVIKQLNSTRPANSPAPTEGSAAAPTPAPVH